MTTDGEVDHIVSLSQGGGDGDANLQWLCREPCHREKTAAEQRAGQGGGAPYPGGGS